MRRKSAGSIRRRQEWQHQPGEVIGTFDLGHVTDSGKQVGLGVREHPSGLLDVVCGKHLVLIAPHDESGARMQRGEGSQLPAPAGLDATGGAEFSGDFAQKVRWARSTFSAKPGR